MSAVNTTSDAQSALSSAANFLLTLNAGLGGTSAEADVFSKFLLQSQTSSPQSTPQAPPAPQQANSQNQPQTQTQTQAQSSVAPISSSTTSDHAPQTTPTSSLPSLPALKKLVTVWRHLIERLQGQGSKTATPKSNDQDVKNTSSANAAGVAAGANPSAPPPTGNQAASGQDPATDPASGTDPNDLKTIADILKELQTLALLIEKQLQGLQNASSGDVSSNVPTTSSAASPTDAASSPSDPAQALADLSSLFNSVAGAQNPSDPTASQDPNTNTAAAATDPSATTQPPTLTEALSDLLTLVQLATKQLEATQSSTDTSSQAGDPSTLPSGPQLSSSLALALPALPSDAQLKADLKVLLNNFRANGTPGNAASATAPTTGFQESTFIASNTTGDSGASTGDSIPENILQNNPGIAHTISMERPDFLNLFKLGTDQTSNSQGLSNVNFTASAAADDSVALSTGGKEGSPALDMDLNAQDNGAAQKGALTSNLLDNSNLAGTTGNSASSTSPYSFASQLSAARATNGGTMGLPDAVEQVILQLNRNVKTGNDQMTLQLNPADLGRVDIKLNLSSDGKVQGTVVASNPATLHLLLKDVGGLERALQEAGLRADPGSLQFSLGGQSGNSSGQMPGNTTSNNPYGGQTPEDPTLPDTVSDLSTLSADTTETYYLTPNRVNLRV